LATKEFPQSDSIMGRCISTAISLKWTEEEINEKGRAMLAAIVPALKGAAV